MHTSINLFANTSFVRAPHPPRYRLHDCAIDCIHPTSFIAIYIPYNIDIGDGDIL